MLRTDPAVIEEFEVLAELPDELIRRDTLTDWGRANRFERRGGSFIEGPVFSPEGNLYLSDVECGRVLSFNAEGVWKVVAEYDGEPNGMKLLGDGTLLVADYKNGLVLIDIPTGRVSPYLPRRNTESFKGVNDLIFDREGNLYFTDQGQTGAHDPSGVVYRLSKSGRLDLLLINMPSPNGLALDAAGQTLYVAATRGNEIWRAPLMDDGTVSKVGVFYRMNGPVGPDGLAIDVEDRLYVANPGRGVVWVLDKRAQLERVLVSPLGNMVTNLAFHPDGRSIICTDSGTGSLLTAAVPAPGLSVNA